MRQLFPPQNGEHVSELGEPWLPRRLGKTIFPLKRRHDCWVKGVLGLLGDRVKSIRGFKKETICLASASLKLPSRLGKTATGELFFLKDKIVCLGAKAFVSSSRRPDR